MGRDVSADEIEKEHVAAMGPELGWLFTQLWNDNCWLHVKWQEYDALYGTSKRRIELMNETAPQFFRIAEDAIWRDILLHLCRVSDPVKSAGKETLTLKRLPDLVDDSIKCEIGSLIAAVDAKTAFARDWRNRDIAHNDLELARNPTVKPLPAVSRTHTLDAIQAVDAVLAAVALHYMQTEMIFDVVTRGGGSDALVYFLNDGLKAAKARQERIERREYLPEDFTRPDEI